MKNSLSFILAIYALILLSESGEGATSEYLSGLMQKDTLCNVWVVFRDKPELFNEYHISARAKSRRRMAGFQEKDVEECRVSKEYLGIVEKNGGRLRHIFRWANAASFTVDVSKLRQIASLPFVKRVLPVAVYGSVRIREGRETGLYKSTADPDIYRGSYRQLDMIGATRAHDYIVDVVGRVPGDGIVVGSFDGGFWLDHPCFDYIRQNDGIVADSDFVDNDDNPFTSPADHGAQTMSLICGYDPGFFMGIAWGTRFILARTEDDPVEQHVEEDNWAAAVVWAEALGVDIITSSLGYRDEFTDSAGNAVPDSDYTYEDMDGRTTIVAKAAQAAAERGVLIVNSMGNESSHYDGTYEYGTIMSPADVEEVISAGAVKSNLEIASFSSTGPTADGRIKPDLVSMGSGVMVPASSGYTTSSGTSFSAPQVAGIVALIKQFFPDDSPDMIRRRLYLSCLLTPFQDSTDNIYGRGIPNAYLALTLDTSDSYIRVTNVLKEPIAYAEVYEENDLLGATDSLGIFIISAAEHDLPVILTVSRPDFATATALIDSPFIKRELVMRDFFYGALSDYRGNSLKSGSIYVLNGESGDFQEYPVDSTGVAKIPRSGENIYTVYGSAPGYVQSLHASWSQPDPKDTLYIELESRPVSRFVVYPNVISVRRIKSDPSTGMTIDFLASEDNPREYSQLCVVSVRSVSGEIVWQFQEYLRPFEPVRDGKGHILSWNCRNSADKIVSPGVYFIVVEYTGKTLIKKVLING